MLAARTMSEIPYPTKFVIDPKILYSIFSVEHVKGILSALRFTDRSFMGFFTGKLVDSLIVAIISTLAVLSLGLKMRY